MLTHSILHSIMSILDIDGAKRRRKRRLKRRVYQNKVKYNIYTFI